MRYGQVSRTVAVAALVATTLAVLALARPRPAVVAAPTQAFILTQTRVISADLRTSRIVPSRSLPRGAARKIVHSGPFVFLQHQQAVDILNGQTLERVHTMEFASEILDVAGSGSLLFVASGPEIHILRITSAGVASRVTSVRLPKPVHALMANGASIYALDDVLAPLYVHLIEVQRPDAPRMTTFMWGGLNAHLLTQAVADRWYVLVSSARSYPRTGRGMYLAALPVAPPLQLLERWEVGSLGEFRVHQGTLYWVWGGGDDHVWLFRRSLQSRSAATEKVVRLGRFVWPQTKRSGVIELDGSRLFVANAQTLLAFDVDPTQRPVSVMKVRTESPIISFALRTSGR